MVCVTEEDFTVCQIDLEQQNADQTNEKTSKNSVSIKVSLEDTVTNLHDHIKKTYLIEENTFEIFIKQPDDNTLVSKFNYLIRLKLK